MYPSHRHLCAGICVGLYALVVSAAWCAEKSPLVDQFGDQLPDGAIARLGTVRFRLGRPVTSIGFSRDGKLLAGPGRMWDSNTGQPVRQLEEGASEYAVALSQNGEMIASAGIQGMVVSNLTTGREIWARTNHEYKGPSTTIAFSPDSRTLALGTREGSILLYQAASGNELASLKGHKAEILAIAFCADSKTVVSASIDGTVRVWRADTGKEMRLIETHHGKVVGLTISPDSKTIISAGTDGTIRFWERATGKEVVFLKDPKEVLTAASVSSDGKFIASAAKDPMTSHFSVRIYDLVTRQQPVQLEHDNVWCVSLAFSPDGKTLAAGSADGTVHLWQVASGKELHRFAAHSHLVSSIGFAPDGERLVSAAYDGTLFLWAVSGKLLHRLLEHAGPVSAAAFSPDGKFVAATCPMGKVHIWTASRENLSPAWANRKDVCSLAFSPDGKNLALGSRTGAFLSLRDLQTGEELFQSAEVDLRVNFLAFSATGNTLATGGSRFVKGKLVAEVVLWDMLNHRRLRRIEWESHQILIPPAALSRDGSLLAGAGGLFKSIRIWETASGKKFRELRVRGRHTCSVVAFSPDGKMLAAGDESGTIHFWDLSKEEELFHLRGHLAQISCLAFSSDGRKLVSASWDTTILIWDLEQANKQVR